MNKDVRVGGDGIYVFAAQLSDRELSAYRTQIRAKHPLEGIKVQLQEKDGQPAFV